MDKETLFKAIRRQEVVLWAGSGFSRYAGYPMGAGVVEHLYGALSSAQRLQLAQELRQEKPECPDIPLPKFAELFLDLHGGNAHALNRVVCDLFSARPQTMQTHEQLAKVAFIEHIVTTNYDRLFEYAYLDRLHTVTSGINLPYRQRGKTTLYKVHGDVHDPNSIIVTESHYNRFFDKADRALWTHLEALFATHTLLFVGYALEDPNVLDVFMRVLDTLGPNMRPAYLVAPGLSKMRAERLARRNVVYLDMTGEQFVDELLRDINEKALPELKNNEVSPDATFSWLSRTDLSYSGSSKGPASGFEVDNLWKREGDTQYTINFTLPAESPLVQVVQDAQKGEWARPIKLSTDDDAEFRLEVEGIRLPQNIKYLRFAPSPIWEKTIDVRFEGGFTLREVKVRAYGGKTHVKFVAVNKRFKLFISIPMATFESEGRYNATFVRKAHAVESTEAGLEEAELLMWLGSEDAVSCYENCRLIWSSPRREATHFAAKGHELKLLMEATQRIEVAFSIMFQHFNVSRDDRDEILGLDAALQHETRVLPWTSAASLVLKQPYDEPINELLAGRGRDSAVAIERKETTVSKVLGWELSTESVIRYTIHSPVLAPSSEDDTFKLTSAEKKLHVQVMQIIDTKVVSSPPRTEPQPPSEPDGFDDFPPDGDGDS
ncbi:hypothetical protein GCM10027048_30500 [Hymenobacter coalescens]